MTLLQLRTRADTVLADFWNTLTTRQEAYKALHGRYFQLLVTNAVADGTETAFTALAPSYEQYSADYQLTFATTVPFMIEVHQWIAPDGSAGYQGLVKIVYQGTTYFRQRDSLANDSGWGQVIRKD